MRVTEPGAFNCTACGLCCRIDRVVELPRDWDRGDGFCKHLTEDKKCAIYDERPLCCQVEAMWNFNQPWVQENVGCATKQEYYDIMYFSCKYLQDEAESDPLKGERPPPR